MTADIFSNSDTPVEPSGVLDDLLASIKNPQGEAKYKTVDEALKGLVNSQAHIQTLEAERRAQDEELAKLRELAAKQTSIDEVLAKLTANNQQEQKPTETPSSVGLTEAQVAELVKRTLEGRDAQSKAETNLSLVQKTLAEKFGDEAKAGEAVRKKAAELGTTPEALGQLSTQNPQLVLALFTPSAKPATPTSSSVNMHTPTSDIPLAPPTKSLLIGATSREQKAYMQQIKDEVYKKYNVTT